MGHEWSEFKILLTLVGGGARSLQPPPPPTLQCSKQNTEQCGYDHAPVTRGRMRAQFPLPHGPRAGEKWIPKQLVAPTVPKSAPKPASNRVKQPTAKPAAAGSSIPVADGQHVQQEKTLWDCKRKFYTVPVQQ